MKAWTLMRGDAMHYAMCGSSYVDFSLIFRSRRDAELYKKARGLLGAKVRRIEVNLL